jgi:hypothetical protein
MFIAAGSPSHLKLRQERNVADVAPLGLKMMR